MTYPKVFIALCVTGFLTVASHGMANPILPLFAAYLGAPSIMVGLVVSSYWVTRIFVEFPSGLISDRIGRRIPIVFGLLLSSISALLSSLATDASHLFVARGLWGLGGALFFSTSMALLVDLIPAGRGRALGTFQSIEFIGSFLGAPLGGYIADLYGFKTTLAMCGVLSFLGFAVAMSSRELKSVSAAQSHRARHSLRSSLGSLKSWGMVVICCVAFARLFVMQGIDSTVFPLYANRQLGIDLSMIGLLIGARSGGLVVTTVSAGTLSDRVGRKPVLLAGLTLAGVVFSLYPLAKSVEWLLGLMVLDGVALGAISVMLPVLVPEVVGPEATGAAMGAYRTFFAFGAVVGPILLMVASDFLGLIFCFYIASAVVLVNLPVVLTLRKRASPQGS